jgi:hypothetical protein
LEAGHDLTYMFPLGDLERAIAEQGLATARVRAGFSLGNGDNVLSKQYLTVKR